MTTPLLPVIELEQRPGFTRCNTCGTEDETVRVLKFGWQERPRDGAAHQGGGTSVALCLACRGETVEVIERQDR